ncbi:MAG: hypothetical protein Q9164_004756, partial [Protoblastenia rupestris]
MTTIPEEAEDGNGTASSRPRIGQRKSSFSDAISKFTTTTFNRRRPTTLLPHSTCSTHIYQQSRLPTPSGIPRNTSFFSSLNTFAPLSSCNKSASIEHDSLHPPTKRSRKISDRLAQAPFLANQQHPQQGLPTASVTPGQKRDSNTKIETRGLMQPMHPPLPRSSTMGNLLSAQTIPGQPSPKSSRPTSSSTDRKGSVAMTSARDNLHTPPMRTVKVQRKTPVVYPTRKDSLPALPARAAATTTPSNGEAAASGKFSYREDDTVFHNQGPQAIMLEESTSMNNSKESLRNEKRSRFQEIKIDEQEVSPEIDDHPNMQGTVELSPHSLNSPDPSDPRL